MTLYARSRSALICYIVLLALAAGELRAYPIEKTSPLRAKFYDSVSGRPSLTLTNAVSSQPDTCPSGSMCTVTLGNTSYTIEGPCDFTSGSGISGCRIIVAIPKGTIDGARFALLPFMLLGWAIAWSLRYVPMPIKNPFLRVPVQLIYAVSIGALAVGQLIVFRSTAGIQGELFKSDNLSFIIILIGHLVSLWLVFNSVAVQRQKQQSTECELEKNPLTGN